MDNKQEKKQADTPPRGFLDQIFFAESQLDFSPWQDGLTILHKKNSMSSSTIKTGFNTASCRNRLSIAHQTKFHSSAWVWFFLRSTLHTFTTKVMKNEHPLCGSYPLFCSREERW